MPIYKSALKRVVADKKRRQRNERILHDVKTRVRNLRNLIAEKKADKALATLPLVISKLNKAAQKKVIPKNKASRTISRLKKAVNSVAGKLGTA